MKIFGNGVDIVNNFRIKKSIKNGKFVKRIFSNGEIKDSKKVTNKASFFAKRFAAKEAFVKALGIGFRYNLNFKDVQILNNKLGKPYFLKTKKLMISFLKNLKLKNMIYFFQFQTKKIIQ